MQMAIGLLSKMGVAAAVHPFYGGAMAATSTFNAMSILQGAATIAGVLGTMNAAQTQASSYEAQAKTSDMEAQST